MKKGKDQYRLRFPEDERKYSWLSLLLEAYSLIDRGISLSIRKEELRRGVRLACKKGCGDCCRTQSDIPIYPLEMVGIYWYLTEKLSGHVRDMIREQLRIHPQGNLCPFLVENSCGIHALRPIGCRQFNVFSQPCEEGEDPFFTRNDDVLKPVKEVMDRAFTVMLPFYGVTDEKTKSEVIKKGLLHTKARVLQSLNWKELATKMDEYDAAQSQ